MRLITFNEGRVGSVDGKDVRDLTARFGCRSVKQILTGAIEIPQKAPTLEADFSLGEIALDLPVPNPTRIYCVGVNYMNRNAEYADGSDAPAYPSIFVRNPMSFSPHGQPVLVPAESEQLDYEGEIVLVIGKAGRRIPQSAAMDHVAGLTIMNEGTIRDWVRHGKFNVTPGKNWDRSGGIGPWIETDLRGLDVTDMKVETHVNGDLRQSDTTASMAFPFVRIIEYLSTFGTLEPGDLIATGTPTGAGARHDPPKWLKAGDEVRVTAEGVGTLVNPVANEPV